MECKWYFLTKPIFAAPYIMLPVAGLVGVIGYSIESTLRDKKAAGQVKPSIGEEREERLLKELTANLKHETLAEKKFVPKSIFEKNLSPQFVQK